MRGRPPHPELLTPRQQEVLALLREGLSNREIADRLGISIAGAAFHVGEILSKLNVRTREEAARVAPKRRQRRAWSLGGLLGALGKVSAGTVVKAAGFAVIAGGVGSMALLTVGVVITELRNDESAQIDCGTSEAAVNGTGARGEENLRQEFLATVEEAEAFLCVRLPRVQLPESWQHRQVMTAVRSNSIAEFDVGKWSAGKEAYKYIETYFGDFDRSIYVTLMVYPSDLQQRWESGPVCGPVASDQSVVEATEVIVQGSRSTLWAEPNPAGWPTTMSSVCWDRGNLTFFAAISSPPNVDVPSEVLPILGSIK